MLRLIDTELLRKSQCKAHSLYVEFIGSLAIISRSNDYYRKIVKIDSST